MTSKIAFFFEPLPSVDEDDDILYKEGKWGRCGYTYQNQDDNKDGDENANDTADENDKDNIDDDILYKDREVGAWWLLPSLSNLMSTSTNSYPQHHQHDIKHR